MRGSIHLDRVVRIEYGALGRERVRRTGCENDVVGRELLARLDNDTVGAHLDRAVTFDVSAGEEPVVGQEDLREERRVDQRP